MMTKQALDRSACALFTALLICACNTPDDPAAYSGMSSDPNFDGGSGGDTESNPVGNQLIEGIYELDGIDFTLPHDDLAPLVQIVGDARVVALGESAHTSGGYYRTKHRLFRYLVEELGFRAFAFESPWREADVVADYVETCQGDPGDVVSRGLFPVWAGESVRGLVKWMCEYNAKNPDDPVNFFGFDIQQPWYDGPAIELFVQQTAGDEASQLLDGFERCDVLGAFGAIEETDYSACLEVLSRIEVFLSEKRDDIIAVTSESELAWAEIALIGLRAWQGEAFHAFDDPSASYESRDKGVPAWMVWSLSYVPSEQFRAIVFLDFSPAMEPIVM
ncbi:MAG: erythromycin esterase family protein [Deltaproteobacteria bacterium]|nr:erythromycin esterase family protein [Deltaproteobacteria bacterium]